jgi:hypothetical protein
MALEELALKIGTRPGQLARVARVLARERINLAAISLDATGPKGLLRMVVDRSDDAARLLGAEGLEVERHGLITLRLADRAGSFLRVLDLLAAAKVSVESVAILVARAGNDCLVALSCDDLEKARAVLGRAGVVSATGDGRVENADLFAVAPSIPGESVGMFF